MVDNCPQCIVDVEVSRLEVDEKETSFLIGQDGGVAPGRPKSRAIKCGNPHLAN
jgi:hypothetical protein